jgi:hypothetical protein
VDLRRDSSFSKKQNGVSSQCPLLYPYLTTQCHSEAGDREGGKGRGRPYPIKHADVFWGPSLMGAHYISFLRPKFPASSGL